MFGAFAFGQAYFAQAFPGLGATLTKLLHATTRLLGATRTTGLVSGFGRTMRTLSGFNRRARTITT